MYKRQQYGFDQSADILGWGGIFISLTLAATALNESIWNDEGVVLAVTGAVIMVLAPLAVLTELDLTQIPANVALGLRVILPLVFVLAGLAQLIRVLTVIVSTKG